MILISCIDKVRLYFFTGFYRGMNILFLFTYLHIILYLKNTSTNKYT